MNHVLHYDDFLSESSSNDLLLLFRGDNAKNVQYSMEKPGQGDLGPGIYLARYISTAFHYADKGIDVGMDPNVLRSTNRGKMIAVEPNRVGFYVAFDERDLPYIGCFKVPVSMLNSLLDVHDGVLDDDLLDTLKRFLMDFYGYVENTPSEDGSKTKVLDRVLDVIDKAMYEDDANARTRLGAVWGDIIRVSGNREKWASRLRDDLGKLGYTGVQSVGYSVMGKGEMFYVFWDAATLNRHRVDTATEITIK